MGKTIDSFLGETVGTRTGQEDDRYDLTTGVRSYPAGDESITKVELLVGKYNKGKEGFEFSNPDEGTRIEGFQHQAFPQMNIHYLSKMAKAAGIPDPDFNVVIQGEKYCVKVSVPVSETFNPKAVEQFTNLIGYKR